MTDATGVDWDRLRENGVDVDGALGRMLHRPELYVLLADRFRADRTGHLHPIREALSAGDLRAAARAAHTVRSEAALLGADELAAAARRVEVALQTNDDRAAARALDDALQRQDALVALYDELLETSPAPAPSQASLDPAQVERRLDELHRLLGANDARAISWLSHERAALESALGARAQAVEAAVRAFEFDRALALLLAARASSSSSSC